MKQLEKWLKQFLIILIRLLLPRLNKKMDGNAWKDFKRVLVFRLDNRFGNSILILSLVQSIKESLPKINVDIMMTVSYIELYKNHPAIHTVIPYDQKYLFRNPIRFLFLIQQLRKNNYDAVFSSNNPDAFSVSQAIFNRLVTKNRSVGFDQKESSKLYTDVVSGNTNIHYSKSQYDLWRHFDKKAKFHLPKLYIGQKGNATSSKSILFWLGATGNKVLSEALVNSIIEEIETSQIDYILAVGPHDKRIRDIYQRLWKKEIQLVDLDLLELVKYFSDFKCVIMPDTGPMHLVAALDIALVQVFVNSNIKQYGYSGVDKYIIDKELNVETFSKFIKTHLG